MERSLSPIDRATLSLTDSDYQRFSQLMQDRFGLAFPEKRRMELEIGVRRAFASSTCQNLHSYFNLLLDPIHGGMEMERLVNNLTIGETHFFRDAGQFDALFNTVLPELIERRRFSHTLRIWSAGCASGEEPYSIAVLLRLLLPDIESWNITILGTDVNTQHLERARRATYGQWAFRETRAKALRPQFFTEHGNQYELSREIRRMVHFNLLNLAEDQYPSYETNTMFMDLILCRNVTIYFPDIVTRQVADRFFNALTDGGWLVIGHSEHSLDTYKRFRPRNFPDATLYQRVSGLGAATAAEMPTAVTEQPLLTNLPRPAAVLPVVRPVEPLASKTENPAKRENKDSSPAIPSFRPPGASNYEEAQALMTFGHVEQARDLLLRWLTENPSHAPGCALLGTIYANLGNMIEAERWCKMAIAHDRLCLDAYYTLALVFQHHGQRDQAIEMMKKVVYIDRNDILGHFSLADLFHGIGQTALALKYLENARRLLEGRPMEELVPRSGDFTVGRLAQTIVELQQIWGDNP